MNLTYGAHPTCLSNENSCSTQSLLLVKEKQNETETCPLSLLHCKFGNFQLDGSALVSVAILIWENSSTSKLLIQMRIWVETVLHI